MSKILLFCFFGLKKSSEVIPPALQSCCLVKKLMANLTTAITHQRLITKDSYFTIITSLDKEPCRQNDYQQNEENQDECRGASDTSSSSATETQ